MLWTDAWMFICDIWALSVKAIAVIIIVMKHLEQVEFSLIINKWISDDISKISGT